MPGSPPLLLLGNPGNRRVALFQDAARRRGWGPPRVLAWRDFLDQPARLGAALGPGHLLRVESPGEDHEVTRRLLAWGAAEPDPEHAAPRLSAHAARRLPEDRGRVRYLRQEFLGLRAALRAVADALAAAGARALTPPAEALAMTDKPTAQARLAAAGLPTPEALGVVEGYAQLDALLRARSTPRVFLKPRGGSSACGVLAYARGGGRHAATTSLERQGDKLYNSLRLRTYRREREVAALVDALGPGGLLVERWVPKQGLAGRVLDLRVLALRAGPAHVVVRTSRSPLTNLHLGNARGDPAATRAALGPRWEAARALAARALRAFPGSAYAGVDVMVPSHDAPPLVAEVNAWGDLLPGVTWRGLDPYEAVLAAEESP